MNINRPYYKIGDRVKSVYESTTVYTVIEIQERSFVDFETGNFNFIIENSWGGKFLTWVGEIRKVSDIPEYMKINDE